MTDPCALEKLLVGAETFAEGPRDSDDSLKDVRSSE
jgi:hypothetical protein